MASIRLLVPFGNASHEKGSSMNALAKLKGVSAEEAAARIRLNLPPKFQHRAKDITAGEFAKLWTSKLDG